MQFLTKEKAAHLEELIGFLSNYMGPENGEEHQIGTSVKEEDVDVDLTETLKKLGDINKQRQELISKFK